MEASVTEESHEVDVGSGNNSITLTPNTGISVGLIMAIIGSAIWITSGQARLEARSQRLEELVVELKGTVSATSAATQSNAEKLADHEAWARSEAVRMRMALNEERRKIGLSPLPEINPYQDAGRDRR